MRLNFEKWIENRYEKANGGAKCLGTDDKITYHDVTYYKLSASVDGFLSRRYRVSEDEVNEQYEKYCVEFSK